MTTRTLTADTTAEAYLELLRDRGIEYFLGNAGTDFAPLVEAFARFEAEGRPAPRPLVVPHEFVAVSMAHGYYLGCGRPAAVMVHVTVGTGNASTPIITASRANVPILMSAGRTPVTEEGLPGARDLHIHWAQESFDQAAMLREYTKWDYELRTPVAARSGGRPGPRGDAGRAPRARCTSRCRARCSPRGRQRSRSRRRRGARLASDRFPDPARIEEAARLLARASSPLILVSAAGGDPRAVAALVDLAEAGGIGVVEADPIHLNFPHDHPLHLGYNQSGATDPALAEADAILVIEADVPWYPSLQKPRAGAPVIHLGVDPFFSRYPMRSYPCDVPIAATPAAALPLLAEAVRRHAEPGAVAARAARIGAEHRRRRAAWDAVATEQAARSTAGFAWVSRCIQEILDEDTVVVNEYPLDRRYAAFNRPGSYVASPHSSGLGFGFGAALGVKLARPDATVIATLGDGAYFFSQPLSCHFVERAHRLPILTVIFNNQRWEAVKRSVHGLYPDGARQSTQRFPLSDLTPSPRFEEIVKAVDGHGERVERPGGRRPGPQARPRRRARGPPGSAERPVPARALIAQVASTIPQRTPGAPHTRGDRMTRRIRVPQPRTIARLGGLAACLLAIAAGAWAAEPESARGVPHDRRTPTATRRERGGRLRPRPDELRAQPRPGGPRHPVHGPWPRLRRVPAGSGCGGGPDPDGSARGGRARAHPTGRSDPRADGPGWRQPRCGAGGARRVARQGQLPRRQRSGEVAHRRAHVPQGALRGGVPGHLSTLARAARALV